MTSTSNFESDALFFDVVNGHTERVNFNLIAEAQMKSNIAYIQRAVENSIRNEEEQIRYNRQVEKNRQINKKIASVLLAGALLLGCSSLVAGRTINDHMKINAVQVRAEQSIDGFLAYTGSLASDDSYNKLSGNDIVTVYILKDKLSNHDFESFIRNLTYTIPDTGEVRHYNNFLHYLTVNDFKNERELKRAAEDMMLGYYNNEQELRNVYSNINVNAPSVKGGR